MYPYSAYVGIAEHTTLMLLLVPSFYPQYLGGVESFCYVYFKLANKISNFVQVFPRL